MKSIKLSMLFFASVFPTMLFGQYGSFDLSKYKLPDIKTERLDANFNIGNNFYNSRTKTPNSDSSKNSNNNFIGSISQDYYHFRNSEKYQGVLEVNAYFNTSPYKTKTNNYNSNADNTSGNILIGNTNRFYNQKLNFFEVDHDVSITTISDRYLQICGQYFK
jgi:hypothetical protein